MTPSESIEHFLATGEHDPYFRAWSGSRDERRRKGSEALSDVLRRVVRWRAQRAPLQRWSVPADAQEQLHDRVAPMVHGLLPGAMGVAVMQHLPARIEVVTVDRFVAGKVQMPLEDLWALANLLLDDMGAPPLSDDAPQLQGFCVEGRAWVLPSAFEPQPAGTDVIVHESAHLLHELRRGEVGLSPARKVLFPVQPDDHETFAYTCERWSCIARTATTATEAQALLAAQGGLGATSDPRADGTVIDGLLADAAARPAQGWSIIAAGIRALPSRAPAPLHARGARAARR